MFNNKLVLHFRPDPLYWKVSMETTMTQISLSVRNGTVCMAAALTQRQLMPECLLMTMALFIGQYCSFIQNTRRQIWYHRLMKLHGKHIDPPFSWLHWVCFQIRFLCAVVNLPCFDDILGDLLSREREIESLYENITTGIRMSELISCSICQRWGQWFSYITTAKPATFF